MTRTAVMLAVSACVHPRSPPVPVAAPVACDPVVERSVATARRLPVVEVYVTPEARTDYVDESGVRRRVESGGAVVASLAELEPTLRQLGWSDELAAFGPRSEGVYLVIWWRQPCYTPEVVDAVYVRSGETLVSVIPRPRNLTGGACNTAATTSLHVLLVPHGEYGPIGFVTQEFPPLEGE